MSIIFLSFLQITNLVKLFDIKIFFRSFLTSNCVPYVLASSFSDCCILSHIRDNVVNPGVYTEVIPSQEWQQTDVRFKTDLDVSQGYSTLAAMHFGNQNGSEILKTSYHL